MIRNFDQKVNLTNKIKNKIDFIIKMWYNII